MDERILIELYFRNKFPDTRYVLTRYYLISDNLGDNDNVLYVIEFIDTMMQHNKPMELKVKKNELIN